MNIKKINPNSDKDYLDKLDIKDHRNFSQFIEKIELSQFRHIPNLEISFLHPISVISGINRSGKSTILMAIACSHFDFLKRNIQNGKLERHTRRDLMQFTNTDKQKQDREYWITYKIGSKIERKRGQRKSLTKKWNGIGKKESQFKNRTVIFIDLDRILPARNFGKTIFEKTKSGILENISTHNQQRIEDYISYILEEGFSLGKIAEHGDKSVFIYKNTNEYSSYNAASGEEVLIKIITDSIDAKEGSLILIDEIEVGLHPKIQRRLIQVLYHIARVDHKQFIITSHSQSVLSSLPDISRIFIEKKSNGDFKAIQKISVNACLSKMDSVDYPLLDIYCEDDMAEKIIKKAISDISQSLEIKNLTDLINIIKTGSAQNTYTHFRCHKESYPNKKIKTGYCCILDGDMKNQSESGHKSYPDSEDDGLHFIYGNTCPEHILVSTYIEKNNNPTLKYHLDSGDQHILFKKMVEEGICTSSDEAFDLCWNVFLQSKNGELYFENLKRFIISTMKKFSPEL